MTYSQHRDEEAQVPKRKNEDDEQLGLLNNPLVGLLLLFGIPAGLVFGAAFVIAQVDRIPGGVDVACQVTLNDDLRVELNRYQYQAGLTTYETQSMAVAVNEQGEFITLFEDTVGNPLQTNCDHNIRQFAPGEVLLFTQKSVALTQNNGQSWQIHTVCDDPRPQTRGRCDTAILNFVDISFDSVEQGMIRVEQTAVDEYGNPVTDGGGAGIAAVYHLQTEDAGDTWQLVSDRAP